MKKFCSGLAFLFLWLSVSPHLSLFAQAANTKTIRSIIIQRQNVFTETTGKPRFIYEWANKLHIVTKEDVIRRQLLFKAGDTYDPDILEESERKLRELAYLGEVEILVRNEDADSVDVVVRTQDQWATLISYIFNKAGGRTIFGGSLEEFNILGYGKRVFGEVRHELAVGTQFTVRYLDPQLFGSRWTTRSEFITGPFLKTVFTQVLRPFYSLDTNWAGGFSGVRRDETLRFFEEGKEVRRLSLKTHRLQFLGARAWDGRYNKKRIQLTYRLEKRDFGIFHSLANDSLQIPDVPNDELIHGTTLGFTFENISFVEEKRIDKFVRIEDLTLGNITSISLGRTGLPIPRGVKRFELSVRRREAHRIFGRQYLIVLLGFQTLFDKDTIGSLRLQYYNKHLASQTLALNLELDLSENLERSRQFLLGGDSGLRGYSAREFSGTKRFLLNFEDRIFTPINIFTVALGGVVFFDAGHVWNEGEAIKFSDLNYSLGFGLRLGYTKSPDSRVGRIDFGWPLNRGGGFGISIGVDQQFSIN